MNMKLDKHRRMMPGTAPAARPAIAACVLLLLAFAAVYAPAYAGDVDMEEMSDTELGGIEAQGLIVSDKISGSALTGSNIYSTPFTFYRMGIDGELNMNMNMSKMQMGCGGINDFMDNSPACDIDLDYVSLMGRSGNFPGAPLSDFKLVRPYIEIAVKNDGSPTTREIVGIKIGAERADGALSAGRRYTTTGTNNNIENPGFSPSCNTGVSLGAGVLGCHSGINSVSGFLGAEMSITMRVRASVCGGALIGGFCLGIPVALDAYGCKGRTAFASDLCGTALSDALFVDVAGTRMQGLGLGAAQLNLNAASGGLGGILANLIGNAYASLDADLRLVHYMVFQDTPDFFLSFQREPVAYPRYEKDSPNNTLAPGAFDACRTAYASPRCNSAYAVPANTGWWINAPNVKLLDIYNDINFGNLSIGDALSLLAAPGYSVANPEFNLSPAVNCWNARKFC